MAFFAKVALLLAAVAAASAAPQFLSSAPVAVAHAPVAVAAPVAYHAPAPHVPIASQSFDLGLDNSYSFHYESADGSAVRSESGAPHGLGVQGSYGHGTPEGASVQVDYVADEFGYQPSGPNVHPEIQKAVAEQVAIAKSSPRIIPAPVAPVAVAHAPVAYHAPVAAPVAYHAPLAVSHGVLPYKA